MSAVMPSFQQDREENIQRLGRNGHLRDISTQWLVETGPYQYEYNFTWLGRPIIQYPQDIMAMQEIIWQVKPDLIIETGIAHGGSLIFYASMLELIGHGRVLGIDIDIRPHNRVEIENHPMFKRIVMIQGSSVDKSVSKQAYDFAQGKSRVLVALDSNHTHEHVLKELQLYSPLVTAGSYLVVFDTGIEDMPEGYFPDRPWNKGNNPKTAVWEFLKTTDRFVADHLLDSKLLISANRSGYLKCIRS